MISETAAILLQGSALALVRRELSVTNPLITDETDVAVRVAACEQAVQSSFLSQLVYCTYFSGGVNCKE